MSEEQQGGGAILKRAFDRSSRRRFYQTKHTIATFSLKCSSMQSPWYVRGSE